MKTAKNISQFALVTLIAVALTSCGKEELVAPEAQYTDMEARMEVGAPVVKQKQMNALGHEDMGRETPEGLLNEHRQAYDTTPDKMEFISGEEYFPKEVVVVPEPVDARAQYSLVAEKDASALEPQEFGKKPRRYDAVLDQLPVPGAGPGVQDTGQNALVEELAE